MVFPAMSLVLDAEGAVDQFITQGIILGQFFGLRPKINLQQSLEQYQAKITPSTPMG
jgi:hypothetical protein